MDNADPTKLVKYSVANRAGLRRQLSIPNPVAFYQLAKALTDDWPNFEADARQSPFGKTLPQPSKSGRLFSALEELKNRPLERVKLRRRGRFLLQTDINRFYHSIYTHSIPWAIHGKPVAKSYRSNTLRGNLLDTVIRRGQDGQTYGVPIGPDTSLLVAEILLGKVDVALGSR